MASSGLDLLQELLVVGRRLGIRQREIIRENYQEFHYEVVITKDFSKRDKTFPPNLLKDFF